MTITSLYKIFLKFRVVLLFCQLSFAQLPAPVHTVQEASDALGYLSNNIGRFLSCETSADKKSQIVSANITHEFCVWLHDQSSSSKFLNYIDIGLQHCFPTTTTRAAATIFWGQWFPVYCNECLFDVVEYLKNQGAQMAENKVDVFMMRGENGDIILKTSSGHELENKTSTAIKVLFILNSGCALWSVRQPSTGLPRPTSTKGLT